MTESILSQACLFLLGTGVFAISYRQYRVQTGQQFELSLAAIDRSAALALSEFADGPTARPTGQSELVVRVRYPESSENATGLPNGTIIASADSLSGALAKARTALETVSRGAGLRNAL